MESPSKTLPPEIWAALLGICSPSAYGRGKPLFEYGEPTRGVYLVQKGKVDLLLGNENGSERLLERVGPGSLLGLSEAISGGTHKLTATPVVDSEIAFVERQELLRFLRHNPACCMQLVRLLSEDLHQLYHRFQCDRRSNPKLPAGKIGRHAPSPRTHRPN